MVAVLVALMFIGLILIDLLVQKMEARQAELGRKWATLDVVSRPNAYNPWLIPEGVYVSRGHVWVSPEERGALRMGPDALIGQALGAVARVIPPKLGDRVRTGDPLFHLELENRIVTVSSPVAGKVVSLNARLKDRPELTTEKPYDQGWVCSVLPAGAGQDSKSLPFGESAAAWLELEFSRFRDFLMAQSTPDLTLGLTSQDGGVPARGSLTHFDVGVWTTFEQEFLRPNR